MYERERVLLCFFIILFNRQNPLQKLISRKTWKKVLKFQLLYDSYFCGVNTLWHLNYTKIISNYVYNNSTNNRGNNTKSVLGYFKNNFKICRYCTFTFLWKLTVYSSFKMMVFGVMTFSDSKRFCSSPCLKKKIFTPPVRWVNLINYCHYLKPSTIILSSSYKYCFYLVVELIVRNKFRNRDPCWYYDVLHAYPTIINNTLIQFYLLSLPETYFHNTIIKL